jgi:hypothetical protein
LEPWLNHLNAQNVRGETAHAKRDDPELRDARSECEGRGSEPDCPRGEDRDASGAPDRIGSDLYIYQVKTPNVPS